MGNLTLTNAIQTVHLQTLARTFLRKVLRGMALISVSFLIAECND
jgi:hypothetical protein